MQKCMVPGCEDLSGRLVCEAHWKQIEEKLRRKVYRRHGKYRQSVMLALASIGVPVETFKAKEVEHG